MRRYNDKGVIIAVLQRCCIEMCVQYVGRVPVYEDIEVVGGLSSLAVSLKQLIQHITYRQHRGAVLEVHRWVKLVEGWVRCASSTGGRK